MRPNPPDETRAARKPWSDRWLLDAFTRLGHPAVQNLRGSTAESAWEALEAGGASRDELVDIVRAAANHPAADLSEVGSHHAILLDSALAMRYGVVPLRVRDGRLELACANPLLPNLERDLEFATGRRVALAIAAPREVRAAQESTYGAGLRREEGGSAAARRFSWIMAERGNQTIAAPVRGSAIETLDTMVMDALDSQVSDIHFEPNNHALLVRYRVDGVLHDVATLSEEVAAHLISRLKVMAGLDIADRMRPQDGRASVLFQDRPVDLRISTLPLGAQGEKAVVRVLDARVSLTDFAGLGFGAGERHRIEKLLALPEGMVLVTGPTGSGKTTTLYSALRRVQSRQTNIVTVEDPIEYRLDGINQVQVHERTGLTFAAALRSILRQDPDVVLVGEIRDRDTADIALKAGLTGHLVLSTLHTNDAVAAIYRLLAMGVDRAALSGALKGVVAQRLVRRLCESCAQSIALDELPVHQQVLLTGKDCSKLRRPGTCDKCRKTGYRGRLAAAEVLIVDREIERMIDRGAPADEVTTSARKTGMKSLWESGLGHVIAGATSLHELLDNIAAPAVEGGETQADVDAILRQLLPTQRAAKPVTATVETPRVSPSLPMAADASGKARRILVVDDDREDRRAARGVLERAGFQVIEAADGEAALHYIRRLRPDAIVTEIALPRLDAVGLLQSMQGPDTPVVLVLTRQTDSALMEWMRELGAQEIAYKSNDLTAVTDTLRARFGGG